MFRQLKTYYLIVALPFILLLTGSTIFFDKIQLTISKNPHPQINYAIFIIILVGGVLIIFNAHRLIREAKTLRSFSNAVRNDTEIDTLQEMAKNYTGDISYLMQMLAATKNRYISHQEQAALEHEHTAARNHLIRRNALPQYLSGLLVGMGLLGTFIGLLATLNDISILISSFSELDMNNVNPIQVFRVMIERMKAPMQSMGIAFSASMFGLLGSIILGLMMVGIRRIQGDIFSVLGSEVARHIEIALAHESVTLTSGAVQTGDDSKILTRIEERFAESARYQQKALTAGLEDFQKQRSEMLRALTEQAEANNNFRNELQQIGRHLASVVTVMEKGSQELYSQISELTIHLKGDAKEGQKLLGMQIEEQRRLRESLDSIKIEERLAESARFQQKALSSVIEEFQNQRTETLRLLTAQTEESQSIRRELQDLGRHLNGISGLLEKGSSEVFGQVSELTIQMAGNARESQKLISLQTDEQRRLRETVDSYKIEERLTEAARLQQRTLSTVTDDLQKQRSEIIRVLSDQSEASHTFRSELQELGRQMNSLSSIVEKGSRDVYSQIAELMIHMSADTKELHKILAIHTHDQKALLEKIDRNHPGHKS